MDLAKLKRQRAELDALIAEAEKAAKVEKKVAKRAPAAAKKVTETKVAPAPVAKRARTKFENAYQRLARKKAEHAASEKAAEMQPLASLSERDMDELTRALRGIHEEYTRGKDWDEILDEAAEYVHEKGTHVFVESGYWFAEFNVQMKDKGRMAVEYTIKAWTKDLDKEFVNEMKYFHETLDAFMMEESNLYIPIR